MEFFLFLSGHTNPSGCRVVIVYDKNTEMDKMYDMASIPSYAEGGTNYCYLQFNRSTDGRRFRGTNKLPTSLQSRRHDDALGTRMDPFRRDVAQCRHLSGAVASVVAVGSQYSHTDVLKRSLSKMLHAFTFLFMPP
jgi:hypothetical protein